jgi:hypothetical protein
MASITRTAGNVYSGVESNTDLGSLVSINGSQPECLAILLKNGSGETLNIDAEGEADETIDVVLRTILGGGTGANAGAGTIIYYQVETSTPWQISVMVERSSWTASTLQTTLRALGTSVGTNSKDVSGTTVTDVGFKLALS